MSDNGDFGRSPRRIIRFVRGLLSPDVDAFDHGKPPKDDAEVCELAARTPGVRYSRVFGTLTTKQVDELVHRAELNDPTYRAPNFHCYYFADPMPGHAAEAHDAEIRSDRFSKLVGKLSCTCAGRSPTVEPNDDTGWPFEFHLHDAPMGTGALHAWTHDSGGGDGAGVRFADVEMVLPGPHVGLPSGRITRVGISSPTEAGGPHADHATAVLGVVLAIDDDSRVVGAAPNVDEAICVSNCIDGRVNTAGAVMLAASKLNAGDVLLIEHQNEIDDESEVNGSPRRKGVPVECDEVTFHAIRLATALGIVVVEPGGNGIGGVHPVDIDTLVRDDGTTLDPDAGDSYRDSGAIVVSAAEYIPATKENVRLRWAPYGRRVDCYARGVGVSTCRGDALNPSVAVREDFDGTSAAAAIIAATALQVQGMVKRMPGDPLTPRALRDVFRDEALTTAAVGEDPARPIGRMPDLKKIVLGWPESILRHSAPNRPEQPTGA